MLHSEGASLEINDLMNRFLGFVGDKENLSFNPSIPVAVEVCGLSFLVPTIFSGRRCVISGVTSYSTSTWTQTVTHVRNIRHLSGQFVRELLLDCCRGTGLSDLADLPPILRKMRAVVLHTSRLQQVLSLESCCGV